MLLEMKTGTISNPNQNSYAVRGKAVLVLGDAVGGGLATLSMLAEQGASVFFTARDTEALKRGRAVIARAGGQGEGRVVDLAQPAAIRRLFDQAQYWLGRIDAVVSFLNPYFPAGRANAPAGDPNRWIQEAILRMAPGRQGQIINIGPTRVNHLGQAAGADGPTHNQMAMLRRQAKAAGLRVTLIEPGSALRSEAPAEAGARVEEDIARCILNSLSQPYGMDVIFLNGRQPEQVLVA